MKKLTAAILCLFLSSAGGKALFANDTKSLFEQAKEAFNSGNYGSSGLLFRKILDSDDDEYKDEAHFLLARSIFYQKKFKAAIFEFNSYLTKCRTTGLCIESRYWIGESHFYLKNYNSAIEEYKRYIANSKDNRFVTVSHKRIGTIYYGQKRYDEAIIEWEKAIKSSSDKDLNAEILLDTGKALFYNRKYRESVRKLSPLLTSKSHKKIIARARIIIGRDYRALNLHNKAILMFNGIADDLIKEHPYSDAQYYKALSYIKTGRINSAIPLLELFIIIGKESRLFYNAYLELGRLYVERNKIEKGKKLFEEVRKKATDKQQRVRASVYLSRIFIRENPAKAIPYLEEAVAVNIPEEQKSILLLLGKAYMDTGKFEESEKVFNEFIKLYPFDKNREEVDFLKARIYLEKGDMARAIELFENFQKENPFSRYIGESNYYLALVNYRKKLYRKTINLLLKYLGRRRAENTYRARLLLVDCYINLKNLNTARRYADLLIRYDIAKPGVEKTLFRFARALDEKNINASRYYKIISDTFPASDESYKISLIYGNRAFNRKNYKEAVSYYKKYLTGALSRDKGVAYFNLLLSYFHLNRFKDVVTTIRSGNRPPLDENQWREIPLLLNRSLFHLKQYNLVYENLYTDNFREYKKEDLLMFVISAIEAGDREIASRTAQILSDDKELYSRALLHFGNHHMEKKEYDRAAGFFSRIILECPGTSREEPAKLKLSEIYIINQRYDDAISMLQEIKRKEFLNRKSSLLIISYIKSSRVKEALAIERRARRTLLRSEEGEPAMKALTAYYFRKGNAGMFNRYAGYLKRYRGNEIDINYQSACLYYRLENFRRAYYFYYKLSLTGNRYRQESLYYLGKISLFVHRNRKSASRFFKKLLENGGEKTDLYYETLINMAIISHEENRGKESQKYLDEILSGRSGTLSYNRAKNLYDKFGYSEKEQ